jgi:hypothetical protein
MSSHNNIPATKGNFYHYYLVIDKLFDLEENQKIMIEVAGDITKATIDDELFLENIEVKYHEGKNELNTSNVDFWKSLKNYVKDVDKYTSTTKLILQTTSTLHPDLIDFENKTLEEKLLLLEKWKKNTKNKEITSHYEFIKSHKEALDKILNQIIFISEDIYYSDILFIVIKKHKNYFDLFEDEKNIKMEAMFHFMGLIVSKLEDKDNWEIDFLTFREYKNRFAEKNRPSKKIIDEIDILKVDDEKIKVELGNNPLYMQKLKSIDLDEEHLIDAGRNKYRALNFANKLMNHKISFYEDKIKECEQVFLSTFNSKQSRFQNKVKRNGLIESSQDLYEDLSDTEILCLHEEDRTVSFRRGFWHILADDDENNQVVWLLKDR